MVLTGIIHELQVTSQLRTWKVMLVGVRQGAQQNQQHHGIDDLHAIRKEKHVSNIPRIQSRSTTSIRTSWTLTSIETPRARMTAGLHPTARSARILEQRTTSTSRRGSQRLEKHNGPSALSHVHAQERVFAGGETFFTSSGRVGRGGKVSERDPRSVAEPGSLIPQQRTSPSLSQAHACLLGIAECVSLGHFKLSSSERKP